MFLPIFYVDVGNTTDQQLEFALIEDVDKICGDEFVETGGEGVELFFYAFLYTPRSDKAEGISNRILECVNQLELLTQCILVYSRW